MLSRVADTIYWLGRYMERTNGMLQVIRTQYIASQDEAPDNVWQPWLKIYSELTEEEIGETMMDKVVIYRDLLARTPVNHLKVQERPVVFFRVHDNTWLEAIVRYLVHPKEAGRVKAKITRKLLRALNAEPDRVLFPKSNAR